MSENERKARDCDSCGGMSLCEDCGEVNSVSTEGWRTTVGEFESIQKELLLDACKLATDTRDIQTLGHILSDLIETVLED